MSFYGKSTGFPRSNNLEVLKTLPSSIQLSDGPTVEAVKIFSASFLICNLLPTTIAHLGPIASLQPKVLYLFAHLSICDMSSIHSSFNPSIHQSVTCTPIHLFIHPCIHYQYTLSLLYLVISSNIGYGTTYTSCCIFNCTRT